MTTITLNESTIIIGANLCMLAGFAIGWLCKHLIERHNLQEPEEFLNDCDDEL